jgi:NADH-quinone oxidoreductase subunit A
MSEVSQISEFGKILIFLITGFLMVGLALFISRLVAPNRPNPEKLTSYECGEEPYGNSWMPFNARFYVIALVFLLFDVEMVFIFPWATVFGSHELNNAMPLWGKMSLIEMFVFVGILILGLAYVWRKGDLNWIKPSPQIPSVNVNIPMSVYDKLNTQQGAFTVKEFTLSEQPKAESTAPAPSSAPAAAPVKKPMFKPTFKKQANEPGNE